jgi:ribosomal protein S27AE
MNETEKMSCPDCGADMNHHANKLVYEGEPEEAAAAATGGILFEAHTCPACGHSATRESAAPSLD